ncbi:MAG: glycosyltransferase [archaeon]|nr:glycosyltransferase [archaeon]
MAVGPKLSVIVPIYQCEEYIDECLRSVLDQSFRDFEVLCVYDGEKIAGSNAEKYAEDPRVRLIEKEHGGLSDTRNVGFSYATGEYIYYLDSDDYVSEGSFERMVGHMDDRSLDVLIFDAETFIDGSPENKENENRYRRRVPITTVVKGSFLMDTMYANDVYRSPVWLLCIRRSFYLENGLTFLKGILHEDELFTYRCMTCAARAMWVDEVYNMHRVRAGSIMTSGFTHRNIDGYLRVYADILRFNVSEGRPEDNRGRMTDRIAKLLMSRYGRITYREKQKVSPLSEEDYRTIMEYGDLDVVNDTSLLNSMVPVDKGLEERLSEYTDRPAVSVVMPVFNAEDYLRETLDDILGQSVSEIELICVDDGSTDGSLQILEEYCAEHPNMRLFRQENLFAGVARNTGLEHVRGDYVIFLDSDDRFDHRMIEFALGSALENGSDAVIFEADTFDSETDVYAPSRWQFRTDLLTDDVFSPDDPGVNLFQITTGVPWNKLFRTEMVRRNGLRFQELQRSNDVYFVLSALSRSERISAVRKVLVHYRKNNVHSLQGTNSRTPLDFYHAFLAAKKNLMGSRSYVFLKNSFVNACIRNCVNNYDKQGSVESAMVLLVHFKEHIFDELDVFSVPEDSVFYPDDLDTLKRMDSLPVLEYLRSTGRTTYSEAGHVPSDKVARYLEDYSRACRSGEIAVNADRSEELERMAVTLCPSMGRGVRVPYRERLTGLIDDFGRSDGVTGADGFVSGCLDLFGSLSDTDSRIGFLVHLKYDAPDVIGRVSAEDVTDGDAFGRFSRMTGTDILDFLADEGYITDGPAPDMDVAVFLRDYSVCCRDGTVMKDTGRSLAVMRAAVKLDPSLKYGLCEALVEVPSADNYNEARDLVSELESEGADVGALKARVNLGLKDLIKGSHNIGDTLELVRHTYETGTRKEIRAALNSIRHETDPAAVELFIRAFVENKGNVDLEELNKVFDEAFEYGGLGAKDRLITAAWKADDPSLRVIALRSAMEIGSDTALKCIAEAHLDGKGLKKDPQAALDRLNMVSDQDSVIDLKVRAMWEMDDPETDKRLFGMLRKYLAGKKKSKLYYYLGQMFLYGRGTVLNKVLAVDAFSKCSLQEAQKEIYNLTSDTNNAEMNAVMFDIYSDSADRGDIVSTARLAHLYHVGRGTDKDLRKAAELLRRPGVNNTPWTHCELADILWEMDTPETDREMFDMVSKYVDETGDKPCTARLGRAYLLGRGVEKDLGKAEELLLASGVKDISYWTYNALMDDISPEARKVMFDTVLFGAENGDMLCMARVAHMYRMGIGVEKDLHLAKEWMSKAIPRGDAWIKEEYKLISKEIELSRSDEEKITIMVKKVLKKRSDSALLGLAGIFATGKGDDSDFTVLLPMFLSVEKLPLDVRLALLLRDGSPGSRKEAYSILEGIDQTKYDVDGLLARMYNDDLFEGKNPVKAFNYYRKAVDSGHEELRIELLDLMRSFDDPRSDREYIARLNAYDPVKDPAIRVRLGMAYYTGKGVAQDMEKGRELMDSAVRQDPSLAGLRDSVLG